MFESGKNNIFFYSNARDVRKKLIKRNNKPYPHPPCKLNGRSLTTHNTTTITIIIY